MTTDERKELDHLLRQRSVLAEEVRRLEILEKGDRARGLLEILRDAHEKAKVPRS